MIDSRIGKKHTEQNQKKGFNSTGRKLKNTENGQ